jgi:hypothetical protein
MNLFDSVVTPSTPSSFSQHLHREEKHSQNPPNLSLCKPVADMWYNLNPVVNATTSQLTRLTAHKPTAGLETDTRCKPRTMSAIDQSMLPSVWTLQTNLQSILQVVNDLTCVTITRNGTNNNKTNRCQVPKRSLLHVTQPSYSRYGYTCINT